MLFLKSNFSPMLRKQEKFLKMFEHNTDIFIHVSNHLLCTGSSPTPTAESADLPYAIQCIKVYFFKYYFKLNFKLQVATNQTRQKMQHS